MDPASSTTMVPFNAPAASLHRTPLRAGALVLAACLVAPLPGCDDKSRSAAPPVVDARSDAGPVPTLSEVDAGAPTEEPAPRDDGLHAPWRADVLHVDAAPVKPVIVTGARVGRHDGFDRLVLELEGEQAPGYHLEHVDAPVRACGSGHAVPLPGEGWLAIRLEPAHGHRDGKATVAPPSAKDLEVVLEIVRTCDFEAQFELVLALESPNRYRADVLEAPLRLVVDVAH